MNNTTKAYILIPDDRNQIQKESAMSCKTLASILRTAIGPRARQKIIMTKINSIEVTNDGNTILREMDVAHPSARVLIGLSQTQDDECGDGTTSVLVLAAELLDKVVSVLDTYHPIRVCKALSKAKQICLNSLEEVSILSNDDMNMKIVSGSVQTKICSALNIPIPEMAFKAVKMIQRNDIISIKENIKVEKILGNFEESEVIDGYIVQKEIIHPQMRQRIEKPRVVLIDSPIEYKKGESVTNITLTSRDDMKKALKIEEAQITSMCEQIMSVKPDIVITEKGICDQALGIFHKNNITALRRFKKTELNRIACATGAIIMNRVEDITEKHVGVAGLFECTKIGGESYCKFTKCDNPSAISIVLRGPTKDLMNEIERNLMDALKVAKSVIIDPRLVPGGGATEIYLSNKLKESAETDIEKSVFEMCSEGLKVIPSILLSNAGAEDIVELISELEKKQKKNKYFGVDGNYGTIGDVRDIIMDPYVVKEQTLKSCFDAVVQLLRVDGIVEGKTN